jgi:hypothetical protein
VPTVLSGNKAASFSSSLHVFPFAVRIVEVHERKVVTGKIASYLFKKKKNRDLQGIRSE